MRLAPALLLALLLLPSLAGCLGGQPAAPPTDDTKPGGSDPAPAPGTPRPSPTAPAPRPPTPRRVSFGGPSNEVSIAIDPSNPARLLVGAKDYSLFFAPPCPTQNVWAGVYLSGDAGRLWRHTVLPGFPQDTRPSPLAGYRCASDPMVAFDGEGVAYYAGLAFQFANDTGPLPAAPPVPPVNPPVPLPVPVPPVEPPAAPNATPPVTVPVPTVLFVSKSRDGGMTWNETVIVAEDKSGAVRHDREAFALDPASASLYLAWTMSPGVSSNATEVRPPTTIVVSRSLDAGATWSRPAPIAAAPPVVHMSSPALAVGPDGGLHLAFLGTDAQGAATMYHAASADRGETFAAAAPISAVVQAPSPLENSAFRIPTAPALAVDPASGLLLVAWNDGASGGSDVLATTSADGAAWSTPAPVHASTDNDQFMPAAAFRGDGEALVLFYDRRADPNNKLTQVALARSRDGGASWNETLLPQAAFDGDRSLHQDGTPFLGDYIGLATSGQVAWAAWTATPTGRGDVYVLRV